MDSTKDTLSAVSMMGRTLSEGISIRYVDIRYHFFQASVYQDLSIQWNMSLNIPKYAVVCTPPPYMNKLEGQFKKFVVEEYKPYSGDLFSVFMYKNFDYCKVNEYSAFMTPFVWIFIKTYEQLREYKIQQKSITTLVQMEYSAFEEATVPICSFVLKNGKEIANGLYFKLLEFKGGVEVQKHKVLEALRDNECGY